MSRLIRLRRVLLPICLAIVGLALAALLSSCRSRESITLRRTELGNEVQLTVNNSTHLPIRVSLDPLSFPKANEEDIEIFLEDADGKRLHQCRAIDMNPRSGLLTLGPGESHALAWDKRFFNHAFCVEAGRRLKIGVRHRRIRDVEAYLPYTT